MMGYQAGIWSAAFTKTLGTPWFYLANSEDFASRLAATAILYGRPAAITTIPDYRRTDLLLMLGANPWVSKGSLLHDPRIKDHLKEVVGRGGRVIVVDPRRTETARQFEHLAVQPGTDPWLLMSLLHVIVVENLHDESFIARWTTGFAQLRRWVEDSHRSAPQTSQAWTPTWSEKSPGRSGPPLQSPCTAAPVHARNCSAR